MNFEYDIFINYEGSVNSEQNAPDQWPVSFCEYLSMVMERMNNRKLTFIMHDDILSRQNLMGKEVSQIFSKTAVFITIISSESVKSQGYINEIETIYNAIYSNVSDSSRDVNRIFKVLTAPLTDDEQPPSLLNELNYNFFEINRFSKKIRRFEILEQTGPEEKFWAKLVDLAYDIQTSLNRLDSVTNKKQDKFVFLAETTMDQHDNRDAIKRELQNMDVGIFPLINLPNDSAKIENLIDGYLNRSALSVHIMGANYGDFVKNSKYSLIDLQNRIVKDYLDKTKNENKLKRLIWIPNDIKHPEQRQSLFINRLKRDDSREFTEIVEAPIELFKNILKSRVDEIGKKTPSFDGSKKVYLIYEKNEKETGEEIKNLIKKKGFEILEQNLIQQEKNCITIHKENLIKSDAVIIFRGKSSIEWLNSKIQDLAKAPGFGKQNHFKAVGVISEDDFDHSIIKYMSETEFLKSGFFSISFIENFINKITDYQYAR